MIWRFNMKEFNSESFEERFGMPEDDDTATNKIDSMSKSILEETKSHISKSLNSEKFWQGFSAGIYYMIFAMIISCTIKKIMKKKRG